MTSFSPTEKKKNTTGVEIMTTISNAVRLKNNKNFGSYIPAIFHSNYSGSEAWI